jgi:hypothetical protein
MRTIILSICLILFKLSNAQIVDSTNAQNMRLIHNNHFGFSMGGPGFLGYYYEHYFNQNWSVEVGLGSVLVLTGAYAEGRYYLGSRTKVHKVTPYIGCGGGTALILGFEDYLFTPTFYAPLGLQIFSQRGFSFSFEAAYFRFDGEGFPMGALKFRLMKKKKASKRSN